uniref:Uncharacterized protein n=1 Tax=viral metagenome TaxID=1070528 RepID=A0A6C0HUX6_9ZZZZ
MASIFEQQQQMIQTISKNISKEKDQLDKLYSHFINNLEKTNPIVNNYKIIDEILLSTVNKAKIFYSEFQDNKEEILYWYDMNEKKFIDKISDYNAKIIKKYDFNLYLECYLFHDKSVIGQTNIPLGTISYIQKSGHDGQYSTCDKGSNNSYIIKMNPQSTSSPNYIQLSINDTLPIQILKLYIDDHLNIILPEIKTIIINNYSPFPLYALYAIYDKHLNVHENCIYNKHNKKDESAFNAFYTIFKEFTNYLTSNDQKNKFNDGNLFENILNFINYNDMVINIKKYLDFMASFNIPSNDKKEVSLSIDNPINILKKDISIDELTQKNISLEKLILSLEIDNKKYRSDIGEYKLLTDKYNGEIYKLNGSIIQYTEDIQKMRLENLQQSRQLIEMDLIKQNADELKKQISTLNETISQYQSKEQKMAVEKQTIISKLSLQFEEIEKLKKELVESRKLEKHSNDNSDAIKKENTIYTSQIKEKDSLIQTLKDKITELLKPVDNINTNSSYDSVLFEQIKELQGEIEKYKKHIEDNKKENELISKKYNDMQSKMKSLLGVI